MSRDRAVRVATISLILALVLTLPVRASMGAASAKKAVSPDLVPTKVCSCDLSWAVDENPSSSELRGHGPPGPSSQTAYDEQLGITLAQNFTSLEYNVTAVAQTDPSLDTGPAYLLNGLSDSGFWYQVGLSYNWGPGQYPGTGFDMNYEVFGPFGNSIYPRQGGGIEAFSGPVHEGDTIVLNLYFSSGEVVIMIAEDLNTGAYAQQAFSAEGGSYFAGLSSAVANSNGFFTGLMTEWYHGAPYYANPAGVIYSTNLSISSGWMWMDEWNPNNNAEVFTANASAPSSFTSAPSTLQEYSYNSTTEYADATEFITGAPNSTSSSSSSSSSTTTTAVTTTTITSASSSTSNNTTQQSVNSSSYTGTTAGPTTTTSSSFSSSSTTPSSTTQSVVGTSSEGTTTTITSSSSSTTLTTETVTISSAVATWVRIIISVIRLIEEILGFPFFS